MKRISSLRLSVLTLMGTLTIAAFAGCGPDAPKVVDVTRRTKEVKDTMPFVNPLDLPDDIVEATPVAESWDFPVGRPSAGHLMDTAGYFKARGFLGMEHLGEDWNRNTGGNTDMGNFVYAAADGVVFFSGDMGGGWGQVIRMLHNAGTEEKPDYVETVYAHLNSIFVYPGNKMKKGQPIGTIGNAKGKYHAHLHFEIRDEPGKLIDAGYEGDTIGFRDPTVYIDARRKAVK